MPLAATHPLELRQLRYFIVLAEEMHFGKAALRLNMTQPPLSLAIRQLEEKLGSALFLRSTRQISLTPAGAALLPAARKLLQQAHSLRQTVQRAAAGTAGHLSLAFVSIADYSILPPTLRAFRQSHPHVSIELREATSDVQLAALDAGEIDAGFLIPPLPEKLQQRLSYLKILTEPLMLAVPESLFARDQAVTLADCMAQPLILFPRKIAPALHDTILACFHAAGLTPEIGQQAIQMQTIVGLVSAGMGIALVPQSVSNLQRPGVVYHPLMPAAPAVEIGFAFRKDHRSTVLASFLQLLQTQLC
ncbi:MULTISPECIES: LysR family transcriptional regulator [unclassified Undibacterium]|uniref:LysR family transcriptional regulator n=1 Tax=unclassified Undibacterium TaxID=2630295 RepID=UPI002AC8C86F|nr:MULTISPECIES: LysR family transcriptional regulator [unclassified Undibacterium]MEB0138141.1 LysR family transcriptional regulator [Undibacterium sp. CCC2.1]MEB0171104.1 LysR family transcriptional regulator [Undibacterium sp. CCC1.1]MEB0175149.1 LysR family transcriptional regulator [Undibacterium sp. CCC3.4]MEB0214267.1 LysR family transcriptional regulator [Undibacterium sp. 5I2]WPX41847.1 LysR family transcriptional regulator [Undibacterium sp. CCC3.4]